MAAAVAIHDGGHGRPGQAPGISGLEPEVTIDPGKLPAGALRELASATREGAFEDDDFPVAQVQ